MAADLLPARSSSPPAASEEAELTQHLAHYQSQGFTILRGVLEPSLVAQLRDRLDTEIATKIERTNTEGEALKDLAAAGSTVSIGGPEDSHIIGYPGLLAAAPEIAALLIKPLLLSPRLLDLAERVMGPFVQGDGFYVVGTPPPALTGGPVGTAMRSELLEGASGWHRDAYSNHSQWRSNPGWADDLAGAHKGGTWQGQPYTPPLAAHMLCYLQVTHHDFLGNNHWIVV